jgi:plasmid stability protein
MLAQEMVMANLTIRNLDNAVVERLKNRAKANNRSLEAEVRDLLERSVGPMSREEFIGLARRVRAMTPNMPQTDSTILLREDRDTITDATDEPRRRRKRGYQVVHRGKPRCRGRRASSSARVPVRI